MWFRANKYLLTAVILLLWAGLLEVRPHPPVCPLPDNGNTATRYTGENIYQPVRQALSASVTLHFYPSCFGVVRETDGFGWTYKTAEIVRKQAYVMFVRHAELHPKILGGLGCILLLRHAYFLFYKRYRRKTTI